MSWCKAFGLGLDSRAIRYGILMTRAEIRGAELDLRQYLTSDVSRRGSVLFD